MKTNLPILNRKMFKYMFILIQALFIIKTGLAQTNFIKTNVLGYFNKQFISPVFKDEFGPYYSLGYEHGMDSSRFSIGAQFNYGYTLVYGSSGVTNTENTDVTSWKGSAVFFDARHYPEFLKQSKNKRMKSKLHCGFFVGAYLGLMQLNETYYANYNFIDGSRYDKFRTIDVQKIWIYGVGLEGGYKFIIKNHLFLEGLFGLPYGFAVGTSSDFYRKYSEEKSKRFLNLMRMELSVGCSF